MRDLSGKAETALWWAVCKITSTKNWFENQELYDLIDENRVFDGNTDVFCGNRIEDNIRDCLGKLRDKGYIRFGINGMKYILVKE
jgi:hypothetical protein